MCAISLLGTGTPALIPKWVRTRWTKVIMNKIPAFLSVLALSASVTLAEDKARVIVEKAIRAQGGDTVLAIT